MKILENCLQINSAIDLAMIIVRVIDMSQNELGIDSTIFEKKNDTAGEYTENAYLYQDIMKYCVFLVQHHLENNNSCSFTHWDLLHFLLENNKVFQKRYFHSSKTREEQIESIQKRVKGKLNDLIELG